MNKTKMLACFGLSLVSLTTFTACQVNVHGKEAKQRTGSTMPGYHGKQHSKMHHGRHHQHMMQTACEGKTAGSETNIVFKDRTITGQCELAFVAKKLNQQDKQKQQRQVWQASQATDSTIKRPLQHGAIMTDAERAERLKQYEQHLIQLQAKQKAIANACQGQTAGQRITLQVGQQQYTGHCQVVFKPDFHKAPVTKS